MFLQLIVKRVSRDTLRRAKASASGVRLETAVGNQTLTRPVCSLSSFSRFGVRFDFKIVDPGSAQSSRGGANVHRTSAITHLTRGLVLGGADAR